MPIPDSQALMLPVLQLIASGHQTMGECLAPLAEHFHLTEEERQELLPSGKQPVLANRAHWARQYLSKAGLVTALKRGHFVITASGTELLTQKPEKIDTSLLKTYPQFAGWFSGAANGGEGNSHSPAFVAQSAMVPEVTPEATIDTAYGILDAALKEDLLELVRTLKPMAFERLILDLLVAMGYGAGDLTNAMMTKGSGDNGIDGIIHEDALGLDAVYIQAKRYAADQKIGRPAIQQFVGSLTGEGANKGVFVTTSDFSAEAKGYLGKVQQRIVLINGADLARLMIRHGVGVRPRATYVIKGVDDDYFLELDGMTLSPPRAATGRPGRRDRWESAG